MHSAQWRSDVSLSSKHVAVVGTGASAVQLVPAVAQTATKLYVLQRSAAWTPAKHNCKYPAWAKVTRIWHCVCCVATKMGYRQTM
jgi:cation diffusion facilitator CzcD-associated flavoprotein CzcO